MTLELSLNLGDVPFSAEDATKRSKRTAIICNTKTPESSNLRITRDSSAVLSKTVNLPDMNGFTADGFVTNTALMLLSLAPYLDLIAQINDAA